jgi:hypothetical protein
VKGWPVGLIAATNTEPISPICNDRLDGKTDIGWEGEVLLLVWAQTGVPTKTAWIKIKIVKYLQIIAGPDHVFIDPAGKGQIQQI